MERMTWGRMQNPMRGVVHGVATIGTVVGVVLLLARSYGDVLASIAAVVFGVALLAMYAVSAMYHSVPWGPVWKGRLQRVDHAMIYLVVAGTFTPMALAALGGWTRAVALAVIWSAAITGIALKAFLPRIGTGLSVSIQLAMGWAALIWLPQMHQALGTRAIALIALGGMLYTVGTIVFTMKRPRLLPRSFSHHELFHVLVVAASILHYLVVLDHAIPVIVAS